MKNQISNFLLFFVTIFLTFVCIEIALRVFAPIYHTGYIGVYQYDDEIGAVLKPNLHFFHTNDYQQEIRTNRLATVNFQENFQHYDYLIFALGDSYTQGTGLPSDASYPFQLDMLLNLHEKYSSEYGIVNLGLAAFGGKQAILSLMRYKDRLGKPDFILYLGASNDYMDDLKFTQGYKHRNLVDGSPYWGILLRPLRWLRNDLEIGKRLFFIVDKSRLARIKKKASLEKNTPKTQTSTISIAEKQQQIFSKLLKLSKEMDAVLIVSWANPSTDYASYAYLKKWAARNDLLFADWYPLVNSVKKSVPDLPLKNSHSGGHHRTWINHIIARSFADLILENKADTNTSTANEAGNL
ncbi:MAG: hypothetical protein JRF02_01110 [Deltaproteobacteria bacterium]|jgi:hypothetical protein|nr:hypothetical protein [Deltaproteobacteria bacterium]